MIGDVADAYPGAQVVATTLREVATLTAEQRRPPGAGPCGSGAPWWAVRADGYQPAAWPSLRKSDAAR